MLMEKILRKDHRFKIHHLRKPNKTIIQEVSPTLLKKLELLHPAHTQYRRGKSATREQESFSIQSKHQPTEIKKLKI